MSSPNERKRRRQDIAGRLQDGMWKAGPCRIMGCGRPTTAGTGAGLNRRFCRSHEDHFERHGSYTRKSYSARELRPHLAAASKLLQERQGDPRVKLALRAVEGLYAAAGPRVPAHALRGLLPAERCKAAWARLRERRISAERVLASWLTVEAAIRADAQPDLRREFKLVQAAKTIHRLASGTHKRWERRDSSGHLSMIEMHKYPASRGRVLRHLGEELERASALLTEMRG